MKNKTEKPKLNQFTQYCSYKEITKPINQSPILNYVKYFYSTQIWESSDWNRRYYVSNHITIKLYELVKLQFFLEPSSNYVRFSLG